MKKLIALIAAAWLALSPVAKAEQKEQEKPKINLSARLDFLSKYITRGFTFSEEPVLQQTLSANYKSITAVGFGNFDTASGKFTEGDIFLDATRTFKKASFSGGYNYYTFPNLGLPDTQEVYVGAGIDVLLNPRITVIHDFKEGKGNYAELGIGHDFKLKENTLSAKAKLAYNDHYFRTESGFSHCELGLSMAVPAGKLTITPSITRIEALDDSFKSQTFAGIGVGYDF